MAITAKRNGNTLVITVDVDPAKATVSKSALAKATEKGLPAPAARLLASTGGFVNYDGIKVSLNAMLAD